MFDTRHAGCALAVLLSGPTLAAAQAATRDNSITATVQQLFVAMRSSDTAATRAAFVPNARVIPVQPGAQAGAAAQGLSVDQFVAFVGKNAPGNWIERIWDPAQRVSGPLADLWFDYDVYHGTTFGHCGVNSVQLQQTAAGWKIVTMAFTSSTVGCAPHPAPP